MAPSSAKTNKDKKTNPKSRSTRSQSHKTAQIGKSVVKPANDSVSEPSVIPIWLQQAVLDVFASSFGTQDANDLRSRIQKVKGSLYDRDFSGAWDSSESQEAYCLRWSPSRALGYTELLCTISDILDFLKNCSSREDVPPEPNIEAETLKAVSPSTTITCIGGGAGAEVVAFSAALMYAQTAGESAVRRKEDNSIDVNFATTIALNAVDVAPWSKVLSKLDSGIKKVLDQSHQATESVSSSIQLETALSALVVSQDQARTESSTKPRVEAPISSNNLPILDFYHVDVLKLSSTALASLISSPARPSPLSSSPLITILFTLNELYSTSLPRTTSFLLTITSVASPGTLLLVVDSPGSYSTVKIGETEKKYPMQWMLDHTLLQQASKAPDEVETGGSGRKRTEGHAQWEKLGAEESRWWRMDRERLRYRVPGVELEDMRMQWHLFRRL